MNAKVILLNHFSARYPKLPSEAKGGIDTETTVSVLGNSSEGAWPVIGVAAEAVDASLVRR